MSSLRLFRSSGTHAKEGSNGSDATAGSSLDSPPRSSPRARTASLHSLAPSSSSTSAPLLDVLLIGSGWTSSFLLPALHSRGITFAYTNRTGSRDASLVVPQRPLKWTCPEGGASRLQWRKAVKPLPSARLVLVVMPLKDPAAAKELVVNYEALVRERGMDHAHVRPRWCLLGSTGVWGQGTHTSTSPIPQPTPRSLSEDAVLALLPTHATVLNLAGLYGGATRHPLNWLAKVAGDQQKLLAKTSLHLVHGRDVVRAILGVWEQRHDQHAAVWGRRWIVTDGRVYDWWQLALDLPVNPPSLQSQYLAWITAFKHEYQTSLPRPVADAAHPDQVPPQFLDRALDSSDFWAAIGQKPGEGPAHQVDLPISPLDGRAVTTAGGAASTTTTDNGAADGAADSPIQPITPTFPKGKLEDLVATLKAEIAREEKWPTPDILEGTKDKWGLTRDRFLQLRAGWLEFLTTSSGSSTAGWSSTWSDLSSLPHFLLPLPHLLASSPSSGTLPGLHFVRISPSPQTRATRTVLPLLFLPGWPSSAFEHLTLAQALANPGADVPLSVPAFDCVLPSYPGYLFSGSPHVQLDKHSGEARGPFTGDDGDVLLADVAQLLNSLMEHLGFTASTGGSGYCTQATDWGSGVARVLAARYPHNVRAAHFNFLPAPPPPHLEPPLIPHGILQYAAGKSAWVDKVWTLPRWIGAGAYLPSSHPDPHADSATSKEHSGASDDDDNGPPATLGARLARLLGLPAPLCPTDAAKVSRTLAFQQSGSAYAQMHATRPSTLGLALHSSPSALLAWVGEKWLSWIDGGGAAEQDPPPAEILLALYTTLTLWHLTDTAPRAMYPYRNRPPSGAGAPAGGGGLAAHAGLSQNFIPRSVPVGYSDFPREIMPAPLSWVRGTLAALEWVRAHERGGHFPALERPVELCGDVRDFFQRAV